jgi:hypothetical protein
LGEGAEPVSSPECWSKDDDDFRRSMVSEPPSRFASKQTLRAFFTHLCLRNQKIDTIEGSVAGMSNLRELVLGGNRIKQLALAHLPASLESLDAFGSCIQELSLGVVEAPAATTNLRLSSGRGVVPSGKEATTLAAPGSSAAARAGTLFPHLLHLGLGYNPLAALPPLRCVAPALRSLDLSHTQLESLRGLLAGLRGVPLTHLRLEGAPAALCVDYPYTAAAALPQLASLDGRPIHADFHAAAAALSPAGRKDCMAGASEPAPHHEGLCASVWFAKVADWVLPADVVRNLLPATTLAAIRAALGAPDIGGPAGPASAGVVKGAAVGAAKSGRVASAPASGKDAAALDDGSAARAQAAAVVLEALVPCEYRLVLCLSHAAEPGGAGASDAGGSGTAPLLLICSDPVVFPAPPPPAAEAPPEPGSSSVVASLPNSASGSKDRKPAGVAKATAEEKVGSAASSGRGAGVLGSGRVTPAPSAGSARGDSGGSLEAGGGPSNVDSCVLQLQHTVAGSCPVSVALRDALKHAAAELHLEERPVADRCTTHGPSGGDLSRGWPGGGDARGPSSDTLDGATYPVHRLSLPPGSGASGSMPAHWRRIARGSLSLAQWLEAPLAPAVSVDAEVALTLTHLPTPLAQAVELCVLEAERLRAEQHAAEESRAAAEAEALAAPAAAAEKKAGAPKGKDAPAGGAGVALDATGSAQVAALLAALPSPGDLSRIQADWLARAASSLTATLRAQRVVLG